MTVDTTASPNKPGSKSNTSSSPAQSASSSTSQASFQPSPSNPNVVSIYNSLIMKILCLI